MKTFTFRGKDVDALYRVLAFVAQPGGVAHPLSEADQELACDMYNALSYEAEKAWYRVRQHKSSSGLFSIMICEPGEPFSDKFELIWEGYALNRDEAWANAKAAHPRRGFPKDTPTACYVQP